MAKKIKEEVIEFLKPRDAVRKRYGMYISTNENANVIFREIIDNSCDEISAGYGDTVLISNNLNGFCFVADNGRGIPISMSKDKPGVTQAYLSISELHSGSKFDSTDVSRVGMNGVGSACCNFLSDQYWLLSRITEDNYYKSIPAVKELWESSGPRSKKDLFYVAFCHKGELVTEGAGRLKDIEKAIFKGIRGYTSIPEGQSTIVLFKPDPEIFESTNAEVPIRNLQYFLMIQEKFYKRKINIVVDGQLVNNTFKPFKFELIRMVEPKDTSFNKQVGIYMTFEVDSGLGQKTEIGSVNGLDVNQGQHIQIAESVYKAALKDYYKIKHDCLLNGLQLCVIILAGEVVFDSQTKTRLKSISKVKSSDFVNVVKDIEKIFKQNPEYWDLHVEKLDKLAESMKSIGAADKAQKFIDANSGINQYRSRADLPKGFADATSRDRSECELFLCFTGDTEIVTCNEERIKFTDLTKRIESGEEIYTFSITSNGTIKPAKIIAAKKIKTSNRLVKVTLDNGESFSCTDDHLIMKKDGTYEAAGSLNKGDLLMSLHEFNIKNSDRKVISVERLNGEEDVYCLEVDTAEHNFPLACGVFAKNCEGLSAGGSLIAGRKDTRYQSVLPMKGRILNVTDKGVDRALESKVINDIFKVIGLGLDVNWVGAGLNYEEAHEVIKRKSRYKRVIIATDSDPDGDAIFNEIVYLFSKFARFLIDHEMVYRVLSPLFRGISKTTGQITYYYPDDKFDSKGIPVDLDTKRPYDRWKGLGNSPSM